MDQGDRLMRSRSVFFLAAIMWVVAFSFPASAEIFLRGKSAPLDSFGWKKAYATTMEINGERARVETWSSPDGFFKSVRDLRALCERRGWPHSVESGETLAFGMAIDGDILHRWLFTNLGEERSTDQVVVYQTTIELDAFLRSGELADTLGKPHRLKTIPHREPAEALGHYADKGTKMEFEVSRSNDNPLLLQSWFDRRMQGEGWSKTLPVNPGGTQVYTRGSERAMITLRNAKDGGTLVTRVYKKGRR